MLSACLRRILFGALIVTSAGPLRADGSFEQYGHDATYYGDSIAMGLGFDVLDLGQSQYGKTVEVIYDDYHSRGTAVGHTAFQVFDKPKDQPGAMELPIIRVRIFVNRVQTVFKEQLQSRVSADCPDSGGLDSDFGAGLMSATVLHEFFHVCIGSHFFGGLDPYSCLHIAIDFGVRNALCEYVTGCLNAALEDPEKKEVLLGMCARIEAIDEKLNSPEGKAAIKSCTEGCDPNSDDPGFQPGNNDCGGAFIPCYYDPDTVELDCPSCDTLAA